MRLNEVVEVDLSLFVFRLSKSGKKTDAYIILHKKRFVKSIYCVFRDFS